MIPDTRTGYKKQAYLLWLLNISIGGIVAVAGSLFYVLPYETLKHGVDRLTRDGDIKPFTPALNASLHPVYALISLVGLCVCAIFIWKKGTAEARIEQFLTWLRVSLKRLGKDWGSFIRDLRSVRLSSWDTALLLLFTLAAAWLRLYPINQQMDYDEAYSYIAFASKSVWTILSDYHLPNNHVFHSLFVHFATQITGSGQPWSVRLPAYFAGVLLVPAVYFLAQRLYSRPVAVVTACLTTLNPFLIRYSANARGYSLLALLTILAFGIGSYLLRMKNLFIWFLLAGICALGFFTIPIMLYPFGCLIAWLIWSAWAGDLGSEYTYRKNFYICLLVMIGMTGLLTVLFYTPILLISGPKSLLANQFVAPVSWDQFLPWLLEDAVVTWNSNWFVGTPVWAQALLGLALIGSLALHRKVSAYKVPMQLPAVIWIGLALFAQRPATYPRTWLFLLPLFLMWVAAGLEAAAQQIRLPKSVKLQPASFLSGAVVCILSISVGYQSIVSPINLQPDTGDARSTIEHLQKILQPGDMIVVEFPADAPLQYYAQISGVSQTYFYLPKQGKRSFTRTFLVVSPNNGQTIESVLQSRRLEESIFDLENRQTESDFGVYTVYRVNPSNP